MNQKLYTIYGDNPYEMIPKILDRLDIFNSLNQENTIGIKPNLILPTKSIQGATTDPRITEALIQYLKAKGFNNLIIVEGSWVGANTKKSFEVCGYEKLSKKYDIPLIDTKDEGFFKTTINGESIKVCNIVKTIDFLINIPVLKAHCQTKLTCALKNMKGLIPDAEKRSFHSRGLHQPIAYLNKIIKQNLIIVDGLMGDLTFEEGGNPVKMDRIIVGTDPVLVDSYAATLIGYDKEKIEYISIAERIGVGTALQSRDQLIEINKPTTLNDLKVSNKSQKLKKFYTSKNACSACEGALIHALDKLNKKDLEKLKDKITIGQGFKKETIKGIGIGSCAQNSDINVQGCPPTAKDILDILKNVLKEPNN